MSETADLRERLGRLEEALRAIAGLRNEWDNAERGDWDTVNAIWRAIAIADAALVGVEPPHEADAGKSGL